MKRRRVLQLAGAGLVAGLAGCLGGDGGSDGGGTSAPGEAPFEHPGTLGTDFTANGEYPPDEDPADGYPPAFPDPPDEPGADPASFGTLDVNGETVRLAPIDVVLDWYRRGEARFVDARGIDQYERAHVYGAVLSSAQPDSAGGGIAGWSTDDRVVTYCGCPHHLSSIRAAGLRKAGFDRVFALDEGFGEWGQRGYPMAGTYFAGSGSSQQADYVLAGRVDPSAAGAYAWATADDRLEAAPIGPDGRFEIHVGFAGVTDRTPVTVTTPTFTVTAPLGDLAAGPITGDA